MRLKLREIPYAYTGKHCEIVGGPLGLRVFPPESERKWHRPDGVEVKLGTNRDACVGFLAGYEFARKEER